MAGEKEGDFGAEDYAGDREEGEGVGEAGFAVAGGGGAAGEGKEVAHC